MAVSTDELATLRTQYRAAQQSGLSARQFWRNLERSGSDHPVVMAYRAAAKALLARHALNPFDKYKFMKEAAPLFTRAIARDPDQLESRFLRMSVEHNTPRILGLPYHFEEDRTFLMENLLHYADFDVDLDQAIYILKFMKTSGRFDQDVLTEMEETLLS